MEYHIELVAGIVAAESAVGDLLFLAAFSDLAHPAVTENGFDIRMTPHAVDVFRFDVGVELFGPEFRHLRSFFIIVGFRGLESAAFEAVDPAESDHRFSP